MIYLCVLMSIFAQVLAKEVPLKSYEKRIDKYEGSECLFGEEFKELGSSWHPDLGPLIGVKYCIKCECVPVRKKNKIVGKVTCRNLELECPKVTCAEPVQLPKTCCKLCPEDLDDPNFQSAEPMNDFDATSKDYFVTLLSSDSSHQFNRGQPLLSVKGKQSNVATGRFVFYQRNLHYSFYSTSQPHRIQFTDSVGNILEEKAIAVSSEYQNITNKVCGVWRRVSHDYQKMLQQEKILVSLLWDQSSDALTGQLVRMNSMSEELFSALLENDDLSIGHGAGTALISLQPNSATLHIVILFSGIFSPQDVSNVNVSVKIENPLNNHVHTNKILLVKKPSNELNQLEFNAVLPPPLLNALVDKRISLSLLSRHSHVRVSGKIQQSAVCEIYQTILSTDPASNATSNASGLSWIFMDQGNKLHYHIQVNSAENVTAVSLISMQKQVTVRNLRPSLKAGWINGTLSKLSPLQLNMLRKGELGIIIEGPSKESIVQGTLQGRLVAEIVGVSGPTLLIKGNATNEPANLTGLVWAGFDMECTLLYEVTLGGLNLSNRSLQLHMEDVPVLVEGAPVKSRLLKEFTGSSVEGVSVSLTDEEMAIISAHLVSFVIFDVNLDAAPLRTPWNHLSVPESCLPQSSNTLSLLNFASDDAQSNDIEGYDKCYHGNKFYEEGSQWESSLEPCKMCHCQKSHVECTPYVCPPVTCQHPVKRPGECCPTCLRSFHKQALAIPSRRCVLGNQMYLPGSSWYPYLPPNGFDTCAVCTCNAISLEVRCPRLKCPPLNCEEKMAIRPSKTACCKVCPLSKPQSESPEELAMMHDEAREQHDKEAEIIAEGGCKDPLGKLYKNGEQWHPQVFKQGAFKCVICQCKDSKVKCARKKCTASMCEDECCQFSCQKVKR